MERQCDTHTCPKTRSVLVRWYCAVVLCGGIVRWYYAVFFCGGGEREGSEVEGREEKRRRGGEGLTREGYDKKGKGREKKGWGRGCNGLRRVEKGCDGTGEVGTSRVPAEL